MTLFSSLRLAICAVLALTGPTVQGHEEHRKIVEHIVVETNAARLQIGAPGLSRSRRLMRAAQSYAELMAKYDKLSHSLSGKELKHRVTGVGYTGLGIAENIALNSRLGANHVVQQWSNSRGHRSNMLDRRYSETGIGVAGPSRRGLYYYCQIFGVPQVPTSKRNP